MRRTPLLLLLAALASGACASQHIAPTALVPGLPEADEAALGCPAAQDWPYTNLVFEGGGVKGLAYGGSLEVLHSQKVLPRIERVAGTSAGSIAAALVALGYTPAEIKSLLFSVDFEKFKQGGGLGSVIRLIRRFGWYKGDYFHEWMRARVKEKTGNPDTTFRQLHAAGKFRDLYVVSTDLSRSEPQVFSHEHGENADVPVADAVRMSMSIPLFFASVSFKKDVWVDGGVFWNYPLSLFDTAGGPNEATLGLHLDNCRDDDPDRKIDSLPVYFRALFSALLDVQTEATRDRPEDVARTVRIDNLGIGTTDFELTEAQKKALIQQGHLAVCRYLRTVAEGKTPTWGECGAGTARPELRAPRS